MAGLEPSLLEEYKARTRASGEYHVQLCRYLPGGDTRAVAHYDPYPVVLTEGHGALVRDADGSEYVDLLNNYTSLVHGHGFPPIVQAAQAAVPAGTVFPAPHPSQLDLARLLCERYPAVEQVRFTNSGTEAAMLALRIARAATGRHRLVMFDGGYHGSAAEFLDGGTDTVRVPCNDPEAAAAAITPSVAAVFAEPFLGSGGVIVADPQFLRHVQDQAHTAGALFVLDEVQALRNAPHGMHASLELGPDLILMGKIIGGGFPVGAVGGKRSLLDLTSAGRAGGVPHSGTFSGNVVSMAAGLAGLHALSEPVISALNQRAAFLGDQIEAAAARVGIPGSVTRAGSILHVHLLQQRPTTAQAERAVPKNWTAALHLALLLEGIYAAPRGMLNLSTVLSDDQFARIVIGYENAFHRIRDLVTRRDPVTASR